MSGSMENKTPKNVRRLGLGRPSSICKSSRLKTTTNNMGMKTFFSITPRSECKINHQLIENRLSKEYAKSLNNLRIMSETPSPASHFKPVTEVDCRLRRRLPFDKNSKKLSKKCLQFNQTFQKNNISHREKVKKSAKKSADHDLEDNLVVDDDSLSSSSDNDIKNMQEQVIRLQDELRECQEHARRAQELRQAIEVWRVGFANALNDLRYKFQPPLESESVLKQLRIPLDMLKHTDN